MQLITNRIHTGKPGRFEDFVRKYRDEHQVKTASVDEKIKVAAEQEEADSSGQLDVEPLHQEGESTEMPKKGPSAKKEGNEGDKSATSDTDSEKEGKDSGQPKAEGSEKFTNDPKVPSKEEKGGSSNKETKKAELTPAQEKLPEALKEKIEKSQGGTDDKDTDDKDTDDKDTDDKDTDVKEAKVEEKEIDEDEEEKEAKTDKEEKEEKESKQKLQFVKWANLDSKNKAFLVKYWKQLFGDDYANALVADK